MRCESVRPWLLMSIMSGSCNRYVLQSSLRRSCDQCRTLCCSTVSFDVKEAMGCSSIGGVCYVCFW